MSLAPDSIWAAIEAIRATAPVVHNITNYVVMNTTANALLALGASPVMAHAEEEVVDMVGIASALVINIGTLSASWVKSMFRAGKAASQKRIPLIFDPVGAGATPYRTEVARAFVDNIRPDIVRGNASEIMVLLKDDAKTKGVDSLVASDTAVEAAKKLNANSGAVVCISGAVDYIVSGDEVVRILNGHALMPKVTGLGCTASALCGAFAAVNPDYALATAQAMAVMGIAGEIAASKSAGPGSLQMHFIDALYALDAVAIKEHLREESIR